MQWLEQAPGVQDSPALLAALSFGDALRADPSPCRASLVTRGIWGEALPLGDERVCLRERFFQLKASSLSMKWERDYPSAPSAILRSPGLLPDYRALGPNI